MILDLESKANNEKYFKSIRYFYHNLTELSKHSFILDVSQYNIYLAAQCIMSSQKDEQIENELIKRSQELASDFNDFENSAKGFLALAEFEAFPIISKLLINVDKPSKVHFIVFKKIFERNNPDIFISFLEVLLTVKNVILISHCITAYNGKLLITTENRITLFNLLELLFEKGNYGMARVILDKYDIFNDLKFIFNE